MLLYHLGWHFWPFHVLGVMLFWLVVVGLVATVMRASRRRATFGAVGDGRPRGLDILEERYAKGEIAREEYLEKRRDLLA
ncbi:MAG: SHOCT domain-containing protein [Devosia sp.]|nr:SHOCT domain-containing protein [Devosia sp.]